MRDLDTRMIVHCCVTITIEKLVQTVQQHSLVLISVDIGSTVECSLLRVV